MESEEESRKWTLLQKDEAQQEDSRIRNIYHVIRQREVWLSKNASPTFFVIAAEKLQD